MQLFSTNEIKDIVTAVLAITLIFSLRPLPYLGADLNSMPAYFLAVVLAFVFHELAHKFVAIKFGCTSFYRIWPQGVIFGILLAMFGVKFVAPGAVVIYPYRFGRWGYRRIYLTQDEMGLIAFSGLSVNLFFAVFFRLFSGGIFEFLAFVNSWLFFFNLLPIPPLDGSKILYWKNWFWAFLFIIGVFLVLPYII
jgi:Zn-dependent protease